MPTPESSPEQTSQNSTPGLFVKKPLPVDARLRIALADIYHEKQAGVSPEREMALEKRAQAIAATAEEYGVQVNPVEIVMQAERIRVYKSRE